MVLVLGRGERAVNEPRSGGSRRYHQSHMAWDMRRLSCETQAQQAAVIDAPSRGNPSVSGNGGIWLNIGGSLAASCWGNRLNHMTTRRIVIVLASGAFVFAIATAAVAVPVFFASGGVDAARTNLVVVFALFTVLLILAALIVRRREKSHL